MNAKEYVDLVMGHLAIEPTPAVSAETVLIARMGRMRAAGCGERHTVRHFHIMATGGIDDRWMKQLKAARAVVASRCNLVMLGIRGGGKTQIATALVCDAIEAMQKTMMSRTRVEPDPAPVSIDLTSLTLKLRHTYHADSETSEKQEMDIYRSSSLLVLDDLQDDGGKGFGEQVVTDLFNYRYKNQKPCVFGSNATIETLAASLGASIADRMTEGQSGILVCDWDSVRGKVESLPFLSEIIDELKARDPGPQPYMPSRSTLYRHGIEVKGPMLVPPPPAPPSLSTDPEPSPEPSPEDFQ